MSDIVDSAIDHVLGCAAKDGAAGSALQQAAVPIIRATVSTAMPHHNQAQHRDCHQITTAAVFVDFACRECGSPLAMVPAVPPAAALSAAILAALPTAVTPVTLALLVIVVIMPARTATAAGRKAWITSR
jgi:hypothetical protein